MPSKLVPRGTLEKIRKAHAAGQTYRQISAKFHCGPDVVSRAINHRGPRGGCKLKDIEHTTWRRHPSRQDAVISRIGMVVFVIPGRRDSWLREWRAAQKTKAARSDETDTFDLG